MCFVAGQELLINISSPYLIRQSIREYADQMGDAPSYISQLVSLTASLYLWMYLL